ncbi:MAG: substrate-binding periplasmic protein [Pseudomonadales bacterium]
MRSVRNRILFFLLCITAFSPALQACQLTVSSIDFKPIYWQEKGEIRGINRDFYAHIGKQIGCDMHFEIAPWNRVIRGLKLGKVDIITAFHSADRERFAHFSQQPISEVAFYLYSLQSDDKFASLDAFFTTSQTLLYPKNWHLGGLKAQLQGYPQQAIGVDSLQQGITLLLNDRASALLSSQSGMQTALRGRELEHQIQISSAKLSNRPIYTLFSKKSVDLARYHRLDNAIQAALANGVMEDLKAKYAVD